MNALWRALESGRVHSAYLLSGPGNAPREAAGAFARALACEDPQPQACERCRACRRSGAENEVALDGSGRSGPLYRHVGDHPDLLWVERGAEDTRVRIGQVRALQAALRLRGEGGRRAAVIADADWLNQEAQNALLHVLEEPPTRTTLILVAQRPAGLLATVRSRCQRVAFPPPPQPEPDAEARALLARFERLAQASLPELLDWAEECRGARGEAAARAERLLEVGAGWLRERLHEAVRAGRDPRATLAAFETVKACRRALAQRNANPQMVAERAWLALREASPA